MIPSKSGMWSGVPLQVWMKATIPSILWWNGCACRLRMFLNCLWWRRLMAERLQGIYCSRRWRSCPEPAGRSFRESLFCPCCLSIRGRGIGGLLLREAHRIASELGFGAALLPGYKDYYPRFGYKKASDFGIRFPFDAPGECCMAVGLRAGKLEGVRGMVRYPAAFYE